MSDIQNVYRSQLSNFITLICSSILLAFIINIMSNIFSDFIPHGTELYVFIIIITVSLLFITIYYGFATPIAIHKTITIPLIFKIENNKLKIIAIEGYRIQKDFEYQLSEYFKIYTNSEKHIISLFSKQLPYGYDNELVRFLNDLAQYAIWDILYYFHSSNQKVLRKKGLYKIDYEDYPEELRDNFLLKFHHDEREKWAEIHRHKGESVYEEYYVFKFISKSDIIVEDKLKKHFEIKSEFGSISLNHSRYSLPVSYYSIKNLTPIKLDFLHRENKNTHSFCIYLNLTVNFNRLANLRPKYEDYIEWINDFIIHLDSYDWEKFLEFIINEKILQL